MTQRPAYPSRRCWRVFSWSVVVFALAMVCIAFVLAAGGCSFPSLPKPAMPKPASAGALADENLALRARLRELTGSAESAWLSASDSETTAANVKIKLEKAQLGKEEAKKSLATAAWWVGKASYLFIGLAFVGMFLSIMFGGIALGKCLMLMFVGAGGIFVQFFILAHGYVVSEAISWTVMAVIPLVAVYLGWSALRAHLAARTGRHLAVKRLNAGESPRDAFMAMPVGKRIKKHFDDEWAARLKGEASAGALLRKYKLPVPGAAT